MNQRALTWTLFFLAATLRTKKEPTSVEDDASRADRMLALFDERFPLPHDEDAEH